MTKRFFDTSVLLYAISPRPADQRNAAIAQDLIAPLNWLCSAQVLQEFYFNATKMEKGGISVQAAQVLVDRFAPCTQVNTDVFLVQHAIQISQRHQLSYWDGAIIAAAARCGADELLSEDMNATQVIEGVRVINPFA